MQQAGEIKRIQLIVHPAFFYLKTFYPNRRLTTGMKTGLIENTKPFQTYFEAHVKHDLDNYGRIVQEAAKRTDTLVILVHVGDKWRNKRVLQRLERFNKYAKKTLGEKLVELPPDFGFGFEGPKKEIKVDAKNKLSKIHFASTVNLQASGQYTGDCVLNSIERIEEILKERQIKTIQEKHRNASNYDELKLMILKEKHGFLKELKARRKSEYGKRKPTMRKISPTTR